MCGIAALYDPRSATTVEAVRAIQRTVRHRGPDDEGFVCFGGTDLAPAVFAGADTPDAVRAARLHYTPHGGEMDTVGASLVLAHRRLSIIDLSAAGHQPMCDAERRCWITYNGEIYNYVELREELRGLGQPFSTQSDTEVMLAAWRQWGGECLRRFNGMFAFVLLDRARRRLFAARDRFGVKPLYYWVSPDGFLAFASEIKQFMVMPGWRARVNSQRAYATRRSTRAFSSCAEARRWSSISLSTGRVACGPVGGSLSIDGTSSREAHSPGRSRTRDGSSGIS
jgi:asparagine synthase (glutamine-hydrolysing)